MMLVSDGQHFDRMVASSDIVERVMRKEISKNCVFEADYRAQSINSKNLVFLFGANVLGNPGHPIGNPVNLSRTNGNQSPQNNQPQQLQNQSQNRYFSHPPPITNSNGNNQHFTPRNNQPPPHSNQNGDAFQSSNQITIDMLDEYASRWTIKARVTSKGDVKHFTTRDGKEGKLMSIDLVDPSGEIRAVMFNDVVDKYENVLQQGNVYRITKGRLKKGNPKFNTLNNPYEITFNSFTVVEPVAEDKSIPTVQIKPEPISQLNNVVDGATVDLLGIVQEIGEPFTGHNEKRNKDYTKRDVYLCDKSDEGNPVSVKLTLWDDKAENFEPQVGDLIAVTKCRKGSFGGVSVSARSNSEIVGNPDVPGAQDMVHWWSTTGRSQKASSMTQPMKSKKNSAKPRVEIAMTKNPSSFDEKGNAYFTVRCMVKKFSSRKPWYNSCPGEGCKKKVTFDEGNGVYQCQACQGQFQMCDRRYCASVQLADHSGSVWVTAFESSGQTIFGLSANELAQVRGDEEEESDDYKNLLSHIKYREYVATVRVPQQDENAQYKKGASLSSIYPLDNKREIRIMDKVLQKIA